MITRFNLDIPVKNLPDAYCKTASSNNAKLLDTEHGALAAIRDAANAVYDSLDIDKAYGRTLDLYGEMLGQLRGAASDEQYRVLIKNRLIRNFSNADFNSIVNAICVTFGCDLADVKLTELDDPCKLRLEGLPITRLNASNIDIDTAVDIVCGLLPVGVQLESVDFSGTFEFSGVNHIHESTATGSIVTITDAAALPAVSLVSTIAAVQEGTGDASPDNVRAISGWDSVSIARGGVNLYDLNNLRQPTNTNAQSTYTVTEDGWIDVTSQKTYDYLYHDRFFAAGVPYTARYEVEVYDRPADSTGNTVIGIGIGVQQTKHITANGSYTYFVNVTPETSGVLSVRTMANVGSPVPAKVRFRVTCVVGTYTEETMPEWQPYDGATLTAELPETVYGGNMDWCTGLLTVTHVMQTLNGTEAWTAITAGVYNIANGVPSDALVDNIIAYHICSHYMATGYRDSSVQADKTIYTMDSSNLCVKDTNIATLEDFTAYLAAQASAGTPVTIVWQLKSPRTIQLEPQQLDMLHGLNYVWSDCGETEIVYKAETEYAPEYDEGKGFGNEEQTIGGYLGFLSGGSNGKLPV